MTVRGQIRQGGLNDSGVIAVLAAVAGHRPEVIGECVRDCGSTYEVYLHEAALSWAAGCFEPTGRRLRLTLSSEVPAFDDDPHRPAVATADATLAWGPILERAFAGVDATWTPGRTALWADRWEVASTCAGVAEAPLPSRFVRLNEGSTPLDRAEMLTQLTGESAEVRAVPDDDAVLEAELTERLADRNPILVETRPTDIDDWPLPKDLIDRHVYEVTAVADGVVHLHNPWGSGHPRPLALAELRDLMRSRYTTLV